jgi:glycosyltransferase involved in cell wall biosynthesis
MTPRTVVLVDQGIGFGGSLVVIARLAAKLDRSRYRPVILSAMDWETIRDHVPPDIETYRVKPMVDYVRRSKVTKIIRMLGDGILFKAFMYLFTVIEELLNLPSLLKTVWIIIRERADIVHVNNSLTAIFAAKLTGRPIVWHFHGYRTRATGRAPYYLRLAANYISISDFITRLALQDSIPADRITTLHNPVSPTHRWLDDSARAALRARCGFIESHCVVTIVGRVIEWKGQLQFLKAMALVIDKVPSVRAMIVGDDDEGYGNYPETVRQFAKTNFPDGAVFFAGYQADVDPYYQISDIVIHASIAPEPFGLVITEAMQNGKPVVGADTGAVPELIEDGVDGFIVDPTNTEQFADRILRLSSDSAFRAACGANALRKAREKFDPSTYAANVEQVYDDVLKGKGS